MWVIAAYKHDHFRKGCAIAYACDIVPILLFTVKVMYSTPAAV